MMSSWQSEMTPEDWEEVINNPMTIMNKLLNRIWNINKEGIHGRNSRNGMHPPLDNRNTSI